MYMLYIYIFSFRSFSIMGYYKTLSVIPCAVYSRFLLLNYENSLQQVERKSSWTGIIPWASISWTPWFFFRSDSLSPYTTWLSTISDTDALLAKWGRGGVVTVDMGGRVRLWETGLEHLQRSLMEWRNMIGEGDRHMQVPLELALPLTGAH